MNANDTPDTTAAPMLRRADYQPPTHRIEGARFAFDIVDDTRVTVKGILSVVPNEETTQGDHSALTLNCGKNVTVEQITLNGEPVLFTRTDETITIEVPDQPFSLETVSVVDPKNNTHLNGLYTSGHGLVTQCEPQGFRHITPFPDRPDVMAPYEVTITAPQADYPVLLSNGNQTETGKLPDGRHMATFEDPHNKPSYLFALVAGKLEKVEDAYTTLSGKEVRLAIYTTKGNEAKCAHAMKSLKEAMRWDEERFGLECDLDEYKIVIVDDFTFGAMENKGLNVFNSKLALADPETATDTDFFNIQRVVGHEYFHNWTGDRVTLADWFYVTLKEGLTVFRDQEFSSDMNVRVLKRIADVRRLRDAQFPDDASPTARPIVPEDTQTVENLYTPTSYEKGAEVIRMIETMIGREAFRKGMDLYFLRHDGQAVTTTEFVTAMQDASGMDLTQFESTWYHQSGTPTCRVKTHYDERTQTFSMEVEQVPAHAEDKSYHFPLALGLVGPDGKDLPLVLDGDSAGHDLERGLLHITAKKQVFVFKNVKERPVPSLLRNFSAPVKLETDQTDADLRFLMAHDSDEFNRYEASQQITQKCLKKLMQHPEAGVDPAVLDVYGTLLEQVSENPALVAEMLTPPSLGVLVQDDEVYDYAAADRAKKTLMHAVAERYEPQLIALYEACHQPEYRQDPASVATRKLKNTCLWYLATLGKDYPKLAKTQFDEANNMTDRQAALQLLCDSNDIEGRDEALKTFYERWKTNPLVFAKWLTVQMGADQPDLLERAAALSQIPEFNAKTPNMLYAIYSTLVSNEARFHDAEGKGYAFIADQLTTLDETNPMVAERIAKAAFRALPKMPAGHQEHMRAAIAAVREKRGDKLSQNLQDLFGQLIPAKA